MKRFLNWRLGLIFPLLLFGVFFSAPNLFSQKPAIEIHAQNRGGLVPTLSSIESLFQQNQPTQSIDNQDHLLFIFDDIDTQLSAFDELSQQLSPNLNANLKLHSTTPNWLKQIGAEAMYLGLDLRGGVYFLMDVDIEALFDNLLKRIELDTRHRLLQSGIQAQMSTTKTLEQKVITIRLTDPATLATLERIITTHHPDFEVETKEGSAIIKARQSYRQELIDLALSQNLTTLRNRINELGVAEPVVQRQGQNQIAVQLPGIQDTKRAKEVLGATATLEFRRVNEKDSVYVASQTGKIPFNSELLNTLEGEAILVENEVVVSGDEVIDAASSLDSQNNSPIVSIGLNSAGGDKMLDFTQKNVGNRMAVVFIESKLFENKEGEKQRVIEKTVINAAVVQGVFSSRFQISGLESPEEARNLALLLRSGALAAPLDIVEERTVGPSLGKANIERGYWSLLAGLVLVLVFMPIRYGRFGLICDVCLLINLCLLFATLSLFQATLTLPGIAGIVLTVGMAVDANVIIFERIRERVKDGLSFLQSIDQGFGQAYSTIIDANITTLIASVILFVFGSGAIKGFAVTLSIGIVTSLISAVFIARFLFDGFFGSFIRPPTKKRTDLGLRV